MAGEIFFRSKKNQSVTFLQIEVSGKMLFWLVFWKHHFKNQVFKKVIIIIIFFLTKYKTRIVPSSDC